MNRYQRSSSLLFDGFAYIAEVKQNNPSKNQHPTRSSSSSRLRYSPPIRPLRRQSMELTSSAWNHTIMLPLRKSNEADNRKSFFSCDTPPKCPVRSQCDSVVNDEYINDGTTVIVHHSDNDDSTKNRDMTQRNQFFSFDYSYDRNRAEFVTSNILNNHCCVHANDIIDKYHINNAKSTDSNPIIGMEIIIWT
jgi:hypothetical protein